MCGEKTVDVLQLILGQVERLDVLQRREDVLVEALEPVGTQVLKE